MTVTNYKIYAIKPKAATNLCTNPSFEAGTTGWATGGTNTIALGGGSGPRGIYALKCTYKDNALLANYPITFTAAGNYCISMDVYIPTSYSGTQPRFYFTAFTGITNLVFGYPDLSIRNKWQRVTSTATIAVGDLTGNVYFYENGTAPGVDDYVYIDGVQIETGTTPTTYLDGDQLGNITTGNVLEYYWNGQASASTSTRTANTRGGGELVDISAYCKIILLEGLGVAPVDNVAIPMTSGGEVYQYSNYTSRYFTMKVVFEGSDIGDIQAKRKALLDLIKPDVTGYPQSLVLRYQGYDDDGSVASEPVDIKCQYVSGLDTAPQMRFAHFADITFRLSDVAVEVEGNAGASLSLISTLVDADYIVYQDRDGVWHSMPGVTGVVYAIAQHPVTKVIYIGGDFDNAGGDAAADNLAKWTGSTWVSVVAGIVGIVYALKFDAAGNLYIGGDFDNLGDANGDNIVKWDGSSLSSLGTGLNDPCGALAFDSSGNLYVGGDFTLAGGVADTVHIAKWDGSVWTPLSTGLNGGVANIAIDKNDNLYLVGAFTNAGDANGDYVVKWTGSAWVSLGTGGNATLAYAALDNSGNLYVGGLATSLGGVTVGYFGRWNGQKWEALGGGVNNYVYRVIEHNNSIYLSGVFTSAGDVTLSDRVAEYLGNGVYKPLDINLPGTPTVYSLTYDNLDNLYLSYDTAGTAVISGYGTATVTTNSAVTYPVLYFDGPGTLQQIKNYATGRAIVFNGLTLFLGETIKLDLRPEKLTMTSTFRGNIKNYLVKGSNLDFPLIPGSNTIAVFMTGTTSDSAGRMVYKTRLHGLDAAQYE